MSNEQDDRSHIDSVYFFLNDKIDKIEPRIIKIESQFQFILHQIQLLEAGETKTYKDLRSFLSIMAGIAVLGGYLNYKVSTEQIEKTIKGDEENINKSISEIENKQIIESVDTIGFSANKNSIRFDPAISRSGNDQGVYTYTLTMSFGISVSVKGNGVGKIISIYRKYSGKFPDYIAASTTNNTFYDALIFGQAGDSQYNPPINVIQNYPVHLSWTESISKADCESLENLLVKLKNEKELGVVNVAPIFEQIKIVPQEIPLKIEVGGYNGVRNCNDFKNLKN